MMILFYGDCFVTYPDGSVFVHAEFVEETTSDDFRASNPNSENFCDIPGSVHIPSTVDEESYMEFTMADSVGTDKSLKSKRTSKSKRTVRSKNSDASGTSRSRKTSVAGAQLLRSKRKMKKVPEFTDL